MGTPADKVADLTFSSSANRPLLASLRGTTTSDLARFVAAPANLTRPTITGTTMVGKTVTAKPGSWARSTTYTYQWLIGGVAVKGATKATYKLPSTAARKEVSGRVRATGPGGVTAATSTSHAVAK